MIYSDTSDMLVVQGALLDEFPHTHLGMYSSSSDSTAQQYWSRMGGAPSTATTDEAAASWLRNMLAGLDTLCKSQSPPQLDLQEHL